MLAETSIDIIAAFLPDVSSMASFARTSRDSKRTIYANVPAAIKSAEPKMTKYQRETLCNLNENPGLGHLKALVERKCIVCKKNYKGGVRAPWGIPAHPDCTKDLEANVRYVKGGVPKELMPLLRSTIPVNVRDGYSSYHGQYTYETVIVKAIPGVIPHNMTLEHFYKAHANEVSDWLERVRAEESAKQEKRKRAADEHRVARQKKQKVMSEERRTSIEGLVDTTYLRWMRTVPKCSKKFVSKLSAEDSVAAASLVAANADLSDETHQILLTPGCIRPCATELRCAYAFVRKFGEEALVLLRRYGSVANARAEIVRRQTREARAMVREDKYTPKRPGGASRICQCGLTSARDCVFDMCGSCCPKVTCERHNFQ